MKNDENDVILEMTDEEKKDYMLIDLVLRMGALEKLIIDKNIASKEEIQQYLVSSHTMLAENFLETLKNM